MDTLLMNLPEHEIAPVLIVGIVMTTSVLIVATTMISLQWRKVRERQLASGLVKDMLDRGMSSDEICNVMSSTGAKPQASHGRQAPPLRHYAEHHGYQPVHA